MKTNNLERRVNQKRIYRKYDGNPLAYFKAHPEDFEKYKNRTQLSIGDSGMYKALLNAGQLEEVYPEVNELLVELGRKFGKGEFDLSLKDKRTIIKAYKPCNGNALEASRNLPYSVSAIWKCWKKEGLKTKKHRPQVEETDEIIKAYKPCNGNASKASKNSSYSTSTIIKCWRKKGLEIRKRGRPRKTNN